MDMAFPLETTKTISTAKQTIHALYTGSCWETLAQIEKQSKPPVVRTDYLAFEAAEEMTVAPGASLLAARISIPD